MISLCIDLTEECSALHKQLAQLDETQWYLPTGFKGWSIYDHCCHLCISEEIAFLAVNDGTVFKKEMIRRQQTRVANNQQEPDWKNTLIPSYGNYNGHQLLKRWNTTSTRLQKALQPLIPTQRIPWHGPDMSARSFATARLMETWAHGQSIYDSLGIHRKNTDRLKHICELGNSV